MRDEEPKLRVRQCFQTGTCSLKAYTVLKVIPHNYAAKTIKIRGIHGSPTVLAGLKFRLLVADTIRMVIFMSKVKLSKFINVTKHLANQLLYRNSHKSNQIKSNVGFWSKSFFFFSGC